MNRRQALKHTTSTPSGHGPTGNVAASAATGLASLSPAAGKAAPALQAAAAAAADDKELDALLGLATSPQSRPTQASSQSLAPRAADRKLPEDDLESLHITLMDNVSFE